MQSDANVGVSTGDFVRIFAIAAARATAGGSGAGGGATKRDAACDEQCAHRDGGIDADRVEEAFKGASTGGYLSSLSRRSTRASFVYEHLCGVQVRVGVYLGMANPRFRAISC